MTSTSTRAGLLATLLMAGLFVALFVLLLMRLDASPRTHVAYLYADTAAFAPDVSGRLVSIRVRDNERVHAGELLAEIDPEPFELRVRQTRAQLGALEAQLNLASRQVTSQNSGADAAATNIARAQTALNLANETLRRLQPMLAPGYVTQQKMDEAVANKRSAQAALDAAVKQADQARQGVSDTHSIEAQVEGARVAVQLAERDLRLTKLLAPFDGVVSGLQIAEGTYAQAGRPLFTLVDARHWYAIADFRETDLPGIRVGSPASVWMLGDTARALPGHVESLSPGVQAEAGGGPGLPTVERSLKWVVIAQRFPVRIVLDNPPAELVRIGATVTVVVRGHDDR